MAKHLAESKESKPKGEIEMEERGLELAYQQMGGLHLEIARLIGSPVNPQLPVAVELSEIADTFTAEPGEHVWRYQNLDETSDVVLDVDPNCNITVIKRTPLNDIEVTFKGFNSKMEYVCVEDVLNKVDTNILARRKEAITRGMDKTELKNILDAILTPTNVHFPHNEVGGFDVPVASGDDLYDVILKAKHGVEDFGDNYALLVGSSVKEKLDTYDKDNVQSFNYNITIMTRLQQLGISVMKIFGKVSNVTGETESDLMDKKKMILVAKNSRIAEGKPIKFVRRRISPQIAQLMGADVDNTQRATIVNPVPVIDAGTNKLAYGIYGYESRIFLITNPKAIATIDATSII